MKYIELFKNGFDETIEGKVKPENYPYVGYSPTEGLRFSIIPNEDGTMYTVYRVVSKDISNCTYNMVDLGLPSGLKWADRNVGATSPEDFGSYFQWGDTNAYTFDGAGEVTAVKLAEILNPTLSPALGMEITADNVGDILEQLGVTDTDLTNLPLLRALGCSLDKCFNFDSYFDTTDGGNTFNKYNNNGGLTVLESSDDAATVHMGSQYRMPTRDEIWELIDNTTQTFIDLDENEYDRQYVYDNHPIESGKLKGVRFTGSNDNSIFMPAANCLDEFLWTTVGEEGCFWYSELDDNQDNYARYLGFTYLGSVGNYGNYRCDGHSVRGVHA